MKSLIERLAEATGPDSALDQEIMWAVGDYENLGGWWRKHKVTGKQERFQYESAPEYTKSIDAAMTLLPKGFHATISTYNWVWVSNPDAEIQAEAKHNEQPAIALCIASLRALTSVKEK